MAPSRSSGHLYCWALSLSLFLPAALTAQTATIIGRVVDAETRKSIPGAGVRIRGVVRETVTDTAGTFRLDGVAAGNLTLLVRHIAYGEHAQTMEVIADEDYRLEVRISRQAIQLTPVLVEALTELEQKRRTSGNSFNEIRREEVDEAEKRGMNLAQLLRDGMLGIRVNAASRIGNAYCVEYRSSGGFQPTCREVAVFIDGVRVAAPATLYSTMPLAQIDRLELLSPAEAGGRYGMTGGAGVLLIETRQGPRAQLRPNRERLMSGFDWSLEAKPYRWPGVVGSAVAGNVAGLGLGLLVGGQCLEISAGIRGLRPRCGAALTVGSGFIAVILPGLASSVAARWAGGTERSEGRIMPSLLLGSLTIAAGYLVFVGGEASDTDGTRTAGIALLTVGTPVVTTFADRVFRRLR